MLIPNSVINTSALIKMPPQNDVRIDILVERVEGRTPEDLAEEIEGKVNDAVEAITLMKTPSKISYFGANDKGYKGTLYFTVGIGVHLDAVKNAAVEVVKLYGKRISTSDGKPSVTRRISEHGEEIREERKERKERKERRLEREKKDGSQPSAGKKES